MYRFLRFLIGAEALRHLPMPKKIDHLIHKARIALIALTVFAMVGVVTFLLLIAYIIVALAGGLPN